MYLHIYQYPSLKYLPFWERHKILQAAAMKYDKWWFIRSYFQSIAYMSMPFVLLLTVFVLALIGLIDKQELIEAIRKQIVYAYYDEIIVGYAVIPSVIAYLRAVNRSGLEQIVETYLAVQRVEASLRSELKPVSTKRTNYAKPMPWAPTENKLKRKGVFKQIFFIYAVLIGATTITFTRMYPPKVAVNNSVEIHQVSNLDRLECKVIDPDIGEYYKGECKDGFAHGFGVARGRDTYAGNFKNGVVHGQGKYEWGASSEWMDEAWEGVNYKGERTGYGSLIIGPKSKHIAIYTGAYSGGVNSQDGGRIISGFWVKGQQTTLFGSCKNETECHGELVVKLGVGAGGRLSGLISKMKDADKVLTLAELPYIALQGKTQNKLDKMASCVILENVNLHKETSSRVVLDAHDLSKLINAAIEPKQLLSSLLDCDFRTGQNEDFILKMNPYQNIEMTELRASLRWLKGKKIKVSGNVIFLLESFVIKSDPTDMNILFLDTKKTDRKTLLYAMENCSNNMIHGCTAEISGTVVDTGIEVGIALEKIDVTKKAQKGVY